MQNRSKGTISASPQRPRRSSATTSGSARGISFRYGDEREIISGCGLDRLPGAVSYRRAPVSFRGNGNDERGRVSRSSLLRPTGWRSRALPMRYLGEASPGSTPIDPAQTGCVLPDGGAVLAGSMCPAGIGFDAYRAQSVRAAGRSPVRRSRCRRHRLLSSVGRSGPPPRTSLAIATCNEILRMPMGYETLVGDMAQFYAFGRAGAGACCCLARALYRAPHLAARRSRLARLSMRRDLGGRLAPLFASSRTYSCDRGTSAIHARYDSIGSCRSGRQWSMAGLDPAWRERLTPHEECSDFHGAN